jgi:hypothetical protein
MPLDRILLLEEHRAPSRSDFIILKDSSMRQRL